MSATTIERVEYGGWPNCYRLVNAGREIVVTTDVGPRIIRFGFVGGQNLMAELPDQLGKSEEPTWQIRGGHRLWAAPETVPDTYALDNSPVKVTLDGGFISLLQPIEPETKLRKEISIRMEDSGEVLVTHRIENTGPTARKLAPWALTVLAPGGTAMACFPPRASHEENLLPTNPLVMWAYTNFADPRWKFSSKYLVLKQDPANPAPQKAGLYNEHTFLAYVLNGECFSKRAECPRQAEYADFYCSCELFTNEQFLELETLGPEIELQPDSSLAHVEHWFLHRDIELTDWSEEEIDRVLGPVITQTDRQLLTVAG
jgi:hypothetical protein